VSVSETLQPAAIDRDAVIETLRAELHRIQPRLPNAWPGDLRFKSGLGLDSLDLVELVARVEQRYGLMIPDNDLPGFVSLDAMADYLCARIPA
jgi:acyl carrier protein